MGMILNKNMLVDLNYSTTNLFPISIHQFDIDRFSEMQDELIDYAYKLRVKDPVGNVISNEGGWQSKEFSISNENDILHNLLINCVTKFPPIKKDVRLFLNAWVNINKPGHYNIKHDHPTSDLSGVLWIKTPKNSGNIEFESPFQFQAYTELHAYSNDFKFNNNIFHCYYFEPTEGRILIFPSHLKHHVKKNLSDEERISVSFNIRLKE